MGEPLNLLLVEDNQTDAMLLLHELRQAGFEVVYRRVQTEAEMREALKTQEWDAIVSDYSLPTFSAPQALYIAQNSGKDLPFIVVSGAIGEGTAVEMMRAGAHDYMMKDNLSRLPEALRREIREAFMRHEHKQAEESLRASERSYRGLFNSVAEAIYIQDREGRFLDVNSGAVAMYGYPREHFLGKTPEFLSAPGKNDLSAVKRAIDLAFEGKPQQFEFWGLRKNGEIFPKDVRVYKGMYFGQEVVIALSLDITERKQAEQALQRQLDELTILHKMATTMIHATTVDELAELVTQEVGNAFYPDNFGILFLDETQTGLMPHPSYRGITENFPRFVLLEDCISGAVILSGKAIRVGDVRDVSNYMMVNTDIRSELCVPIKVGERSLGVINAESREFDFFSAEDERLLLTIAGQLALAIQQLRLFEAERRRRQEAETLRSATATLATSLELDQVLKDILASIAQVVPYDSATVFLLDGDFLRVMMARGIPDDILNRTFSADDLLFREIQRTHQPLVLQDVQGDARFLGWGGTSYVHGWMGIPLIVRDEVTGYITLDNHQKAAYGQEEASLAQAFANQAAIAIENARLFKAIQQSLSELNQAYDVTIEGWSHAMELRDRETEGHTLRVTEMTLRLAHEMGIHGDDLTHIRRGALLHDIGKMGVPDRILLKPEELTDDEWKIMRQHPQYALDMLISIDYLQPALAIPYAHHERWDGSGYPLGLRGAEIPLFARIFTVVDVWDALTSDRPYRPAWSKKVAYEYILEHSGRHFDPEVVRAFVNLWDAGKL